MRVTLIAAMAEDRVIGRDGGMPWHLPDDLKRFKRLTMGHAIIMGRRTWDSIGRALPGRASIVITRNKEFDAPGAVVVSSLDEALAHVAATEGTDAFIVGGGEIYTQALPRADRLELTLIHRRFEGDTRFPAFDAAAWREVAREDHTASGVALPYSFVTLERPSA